MYEFDPMPYNRILSFCGIDLARGGGRAKAAKVVAATAEILDV